MTKKFKTQAVECEYAWLYRAAVQKFFRLPVRAIIHSLNEEELNFNIDRFGNEHDFEAFSKVMPKFQRLYKIRIYGRYFHDYVKKAEWTVLSGTLPTKTPSFKRKTNIGAYWRQPMPMLSKDLSKVKEDADEVNASQVVAKMNKLCKVIEPSLEPNNLLQSLNLCGLNIEASGWVALSRGIKANQTCQTLTLNFCNVTDQACISLGAAIGFNIRKLDLSNNLIRERGAFEIGKMVQKHWEHRDSTMFKTSLRGKAEISKKPEGITELYLANNELQDKGAGTISSTLFHDIYLQVLDLRRNKLEEHGMRDILSLIKTNKTLLILDTRENTDDEENSVTRTILRCLKRNIRLYRNKSGTDYNDIYEGRLLEFYNELGADYRADSHIEISPDTTQRPGSRSISRPRSFMSKMRNNSRRRPRGRSNRNISLDISKWKEIEQTLQATESRCDTLARENKKLREQMRRPVSYGGAFDKENDEENEMLQKIEGVMVDIKKMMKRK